MTVQAKFLVETLDLRHTGDRWPFAERERARIDAHWERIAEANPSLWNGEVLMCHSVEVEDSCLAARFLTTDYASFVAWRDWGWPDPSVRNCFGSAIVLSNDNALIYGKMSEKTLNPGQVYPPGGSLEPRDITADGFVDVEGSLVRELEEETGLKACDAHSGEWLVVFEDLRLALAKILRFDRPADAIAAAADRHIAEAKEEELAGIEVIRSASQIDPRMPGFAAEIVRHFLER